MHNICLANFIEKFEEGALLKKNVHLFRSFRNMRCLRERYTFLEVFRKSATIKGITHCFTWSASWEAHFRLPTFSPADFFRNSETKMCFFLYTELYGQQINFVNRFPAQSYKAFHPYLWLSELAPDLSTKDIVLVCSPAGHRKSLVRPSAHSNRLHDAP